MSGIRGWALAGLLVLVTTWYGCSKSEGPSGPGDTTPPARTTTLNAGSPTTGSVTLTWTAAGDDGTSGRATRYDIRYSTLAINEVTWPSAHQVTTPPAPRTAGSTETFVVTGLDPATTYRFALKTGDEVPNFSTLSNVATATTASTDTIAPAVVGDLTTSEIGSNSIQLDWTSPGDDGNIGTAATYDLRYSTSAITAGNFGSATPVIGPPAPTVAGTRQSVTVNGLDPLTTYYFALKTADEVPNWSGISNLPQATTSEPDTIPPSAVALAIGSAPGSVTSDSIEVTWTAPGDDSTTGTASQYDLRYSTSDITDEATWQLATPVNPPPTVHAPGTHESFFVHGLVPTTTYYLALKTADEVPNWSARSTSVSATTLEGWAALGAGMNSNVFCLVGRGASLYAGGAFSASIGQPGNQIARWDGNSWHSVGSGTFGLVQTLGLLGSDLIAGGYFNTAGGVAANNIARWDGASWNPLGSGTGGLVSALAVYNTDLIAGGGFTTAGGSPANHIARWDGAWHALGTGLDGGVASLEVYANDLVVGGYFTTAGGDTVNNVARWDGATWSSLGSGIDGRVACLVVYGGDLIAGGSFSHAGGVPADNIARWDGASWSALGSGVTGTPGTSVTSLTVYNGNLVVGGSFTTAGGLAANHIARWNGSSWRTMGSGTSDVVAALTIYGFDLVAGGQFIYAGATEVHYITRWHE